MVAAISRLASLLKQATAGDVPLPAAKPDPAKTTLNKTLVTPRPPLGAEPMPSLAPPLVVPAMSAAMQKETSTQVIEAYRAALELEETEPMPTNQRSSMARGAVTDAETGSRSLPGQPAAGSDAPSRVLPMPAYSLTLPLSAAARQAQADEAATAKKRPAPVKAGSKTSGDIPLETMVSARSIAFGLAAFALLLLIVLLVF